MWLQIEHYLDRTRLQTLVAAWSKTPIQTR
jgi:hypothetical protein